jgi:hypothetical protein
MARKRKIHMFDNYSVDMTKTYIRCIQKPVAAFSFFATSDKNKVTCEHCRKKLGLDNVSDGKTYFDKDEAKAAHAAISESVGSKAETTKEIVANALLPEFDDTKYEYFTHTKAEKNDERWDIYDRKWHTAQSCTYALIRRKKVLQGADLVGKLCFVSGAGLDDAMMYSDDYVFNMLKEIASYDIKSCEYYDKNGISWKYAYPLDLDAFNEKYNKKDK